MDFEAAFDAVGQATWDELFAGAAENFRAHDIAVCRSVSQFFGAASRAGDAVVSVMR